MKLLSFYRSKGISLQLFPNDEGFVNTILKNSDNFTCNSIDRFRPELFEFFDSDPLTAFFSENLSLIDHPKVIHRIMNANEFIGKQSKFLLPDEVINRKNFFLKRIKENLYFDDGKFISDIQKALQTRIFLLNDD